jgi:DNA-binding GntR family transcriptional regulator
MKVLHRIQLLPAREQVAASLRKAILTRELKKGDIITLERIASQLGVSSTPVREAFQILAGDGLIRLRPNKGAIVLGISKKTIHDHYETRAILESAAAAMACREGTDLSDVVNSFEQAETALAKHDSREYSNYNQAFHMAIWTAAGNEKIKSLLSSMWNGLSMGHKMTRDTYAQISIKEHRKILDALTAHNAATAGGLMKDHIMRSMENVLTHFPEEVNP